MRLVRGLIQLQPLAAGCVLSMGNFDGVHSGHQAVINKLAEQGKLMNLPTVLMLFEPQPLEFFLAENAPARLMCLREKVMQLKSLPIDKLVVVNFNQRMANYEAEDFIKDLLVAKLKVKHLVIGDDFHFGKARRGNFAMLKQAGLRYGFKVEDTHSCLVEGYRVSSTLIRDAIGAGNLFAAKQMLGRDYSVCGRVVHGSKRGRTLGFPTANIKIARKNIPLTGVYAVTMTGIGEQQISGVANVGTRPTVGSEKKVLLEIHLFDFDQQIYRHYVEVHFKQKIRDEVHFDSLDKLKTQIANDIIIAKKIASA